MNGTVMGISTRTRRRTVTLHWVPGHDREGRPIMEMRWFVENCPPVVTERRAA